MYKKILFLVLITSFIIGCSNKRDECNIQDRSDFEQLFTKDEIYHRSLMNTQKAQLIASFETKALLTATYLNPVFTRKLCKKQFMHMMDDGEYFFVGIFISDSEKHEFNTKGYSLTLNGLAPIDIKLLEKDDALRYEMPMVNNWSSYYRVKFRKSSKAELELIFGNDRFGRDILNFSKGEKSLLESLKDLNKQHNW